MKELKVFLIMNSAVAALLLVLGAYTYLSVSNTNGTSMLIGSSLSEAEKKIDDEKSPSALRDSAKYYLALASIYEGTSRKGANVVVILCVLSASMLSISAIAMKRVLNQGTL